MVWDNLPLPVSLTAHLCGLLVRGGVGRRGDKGVAECEGGLHSTSENRRGRWQTSVVKERGGSMEKTERL